MLIYKNDNEVLDLVKGFETQSLPKAEWTHAAHLTVGLFYCLRYSSGMAKNIMRDGIYWLNDKHGTPNTDSSGYHETLTVFWMKMIEDFLQRRKQNDSLSVLANDLVVSFNDPKLPLKFYSRELLFSPEARAKYVEPDLIIGFCQTTFLTDYAKPNEMPEVSVKSVNTL